MNRYCIFITNKASNFIKYFYNNFNDTLKIYEVGNHVLNTLEVDPNSPRTTQDKERLSAPQMKELLPYEQETDRNVFLRPPAGITSVSSETEGALGVMLDDMLAGIYTTIILIIIFFFIGA